MSDWNTVETTSMPTDASNFLLQVSAEDAYEAALEQEAAVSDDFLSPAFLNEHNKPTFVTDLILVRFASEVTRDEANAVLEKEGGTILVSDWADMTNAYKVRCVTHNGFDVLRIANKLAKRDDVVFAEPNMAFTMDDFSAPPAATFGSCNALMSQFSFLNPAFNPSFLLNYTPSSSNNPLFDSQWALRNSNSQYAGLANIDLGATDAWDLTLGDPNIKVVVLDTGVQQNHPDINQLGGGDFWNPGSGYNGGPIDSGDNHGTTVAGVISGILNNNIGIVGIAPNVKVVSARIGGQNATTTNPNTWSTNAPVAEGIAWAQAIGARITVCANSIPAYASITQKYNDTWNNGNGILHFAASGNSNAYGLPYPANLQSVVAVGAFNSSGNRWVNGSQGSSYGDKVPADPVYPGVSFLAPGVDVWTTDRTGSAGYATGDYYKATGTSYAAPYAAGVAALIMSYNPNLNASNVRGYMMLTSEQVVQYELPGYAYTTVEEGYGRISARRVLRQLQQGSAPGGIVVMNIDHDFYTGSNHDPYSLYKPWHADNIAVAPGQDFYFDYRISVSGGGTLNISNVSLTNVSGSGTMYLESPTSMSVSGQNSVYIRVRYRGTTRGASRSVILSFKSNDYDAETKYIKITGYTQ